MKVYLAARFSRRDELNRYRTELEAEGITVTSRWLLGGHEWVGTPDEAIPRPKLAQFAVEDLADLMAADVVVCFTESPRSGPARGGRHTEFGYALAKGKPVVCVGHIENVFYALPDVLYVESWEAALHVLLNAAATGGVAMRACRVCGCTDAWGCDEGCWWVDEDLCSSCAEAGREAS